MLSWEPPNPKDGMQVGEIGWCCTLCREFGVYIKVGHIPDSQAEMLMNAFDATMDVIREDHIARHLADMSATVEELTQ